MILLSNLFALHKYWAVHYRKELLIGGRKVEDADKMNKTAKIEKHKHTRYIFAFIAVFITAYNHLYHVGINTGVKTLHNLFSVSHELRQLHKLGVVRRNLFQRPLAHSMQVLNFCSFCNRILKFSEFNDFTFIIIVDFINLL